MSHFGAILPVDHSRLDVSHLTAIPVFICYPLVMIDFERAKKTPSQYFAGPQDVVEHDSLPKAAKIDILLRWKHEELQLETAQDENMQSSKASRLREVLQALRSLGYEER